ncbi:MAG: prepilin-type N-terminal cleavage/methylation domain-containing protein [Planctomycetes bacterium]|nr:prepilin-type N-terminal cleavage/methylation domain-containing protein [Planctomycetota bacterium]
MRSRRAGFTLLEVLLATAILAMILGVLYSVLITTLRSGRMVEEELATANLGPTVMNLIAQDLRSVYLPDRGGKWFQGRDSGFASSELDRIDFVASIDGTDPETTLQYPYSELGYQMLPNDEEAGLYILYRRRSPGFDDEPLKGGSLEELYDRAVSLNFEYTDGKEWVREWKSWEKQGTLPRAVKVAFVYRMKAGAVEEVERDEEYTSSIVVPLPR